MRGSAAGWVTVTSDHPITAGGFTMATTQEDVRRIALSLPQVTEGDPGKFFTEPHYNGFPAVLVRLPAIDAGELAELITDAWRCQAPRSLAADFGRPPLYRRPMTDVTRRW